MIPKTQKLIDSEKKSDACEKPGSCKGVCKTVVEPASIQIKELDVLNDFVAILRFEEESTIELPDNQRLKNEGIVIGVGNNNDNPRAAIVPGDVVLFLPRNIVTEIKGTKFPYENKTITILSRQNIIMRLDSIPHEFINETIDA
jgi:co-chaperonin GroES (HSP10)